MSTDITKHSLDSLLIAWRGWQRAQSLSDRTIRERAFTMRHLVAHSGNHPLTLTSFDIMSFIGRDGISPTTRWTYHQVIRSYCQWLVKVDLREDDPTLKTPVPKRPRSKPRPVSHEQLVAMLTAANRRRTKTMILLGALAGLRVHEIAKMHGADIDIMARTLTVTGKGGKTERIPLHEVLVEEAGKYPRDDWWFPAYSAQGPKHPHIDRQAVTLAIGRAMKRAGFKGTAHQLRHWYGSSLLESGVDIRIVQTLMRHESIQSTQIYTLVSGKQERAGMDLLVLPTRS